VPSLGRLTSSDGERGCVRASTQPMRKEGSGAPQNKSALVTGAQRGIGAAIARRLAAGGARVWINAIEELDQARELASELGGEVIEADVADRAQVERMLERTGSLDILVNNAADQTYEPLLGADPKAWERTLAVNVTGAMLTIRAGGPRMRAGAAIVNVASMHSFVPLAGAAAYATSKGALAALTRQAAVELGERGVRVNAVAPGAIDLTGVEKRRRPGGHPMYANLPLRRAGTPEEVAAVVAFLASEDASYVTGAVWPVDGGALVQHPWPRGGDRSPDRLR
jgi:NAD(P)-dependent dehydrogenase (short-subunit alcohol dehydrogenase family)